MPIVFILFIVIPIIEITILINVGQLIGAWYTIALVLFSAFVGVNMLRYQGLATLGRAQQKMSQGEMPQQEMIEGLVLAVGGALLITPGFVTDVIGFCCLVPLTRIGFIKIVSHRFKHSMSAKMSGAASFGSMNSGSFHSETSADADAKSGDVFEGEYSKEAEAKYTLRDINLDKQDNNHDNKD
ncbi:MAG: FxsA family protein [Oceanospirillaceae bacterium]